MKRMVRWTASVIAVGATCWLLLAWVRREGVWEGLFPLFASPGWLVPATFCYTVSFLLKAWAWRAYVNGQLSWSLSIQGLYASLFVNHVLPVKAGDMVRAGLAAREPKLGWDGALHSVVALRSLDLLTLGAIAATGALLYGLDSPAAGYGRLLAAGAIAAAAVLLLFILGRKTTLAGFAGKHLRMAASVLSGPRGLTVVVLTAVSWVLEAAVIWSAARALGLELAIGAAVWVTAMTVAGQVFHFTPGGIGTYESVMTGSLAVLGIPVETAFAAAWAAHGYKFVYSYAAGGLLLGCTAVTWRQMRDWTRWTSKSPTLNPSNSKGRTKR